MLSSDMDLHYLSCVCRKIGEGKSDLGLHYLENFEY